MKTFILSCVLVILGGSIVHGQVITSAEYFFDNDPGHGLGISVNIPTPDDSVSISAAVDAAALGVGFHRLAFRFRDAAGQWSMAAGRTLYVYDGLPGGGELLSPPVTAGEYFFDVDPGPGAGTAFTATPGDSTTTAFALDTDPLPVGFHTLNMRFKDASGHWGLSVGRLFYLFDTALIAPAAPLVAAEYFFDTDPGTGNATAISIGSPQDSISVTPLIDASSLPLGDHFMFIRVKDQSGVWSMVESRNFRVCETYGPLAEFTPIVSGTSVSFQNASTFATNYEWDFGDGSASVLQYPVHAYPAGAYSPTLVANNTCGTDTAFAAIEVLGLNAFWPHSGGNTGFVTVALHGYGFDTATVVKLVRAGFPDVGTVDDLIAVSDPSSATVTFDLNGVEEGEWSVVVQFVTTGVSATSTGAFIVEPGDSGYHLTASLIGSSVIRGSGTYTLRIQNASNIDAELIPVEISLSDTLGSLVVLRELLTYGWPDSLIDNNLNSITYSLDDSLTYQRFYYFISPIVPAYTTVDIPVRLTLPIGSVGSVSVVLGDPMDLDPIVIQELVDQLMLAQSTSGLLSNEFRENCQISEQPRRLMKNLNLGLALAAVGVALIPGGQVAALALGSAAIAGNIADWSLDMKVATRSGDITQVPSLFDTFNTFSFGISLPFAAGRTASKLAAREVIKSTLIERTELGLSTSGNVGTALDIAKQQAEAAGTIISGVTGCPPPIPGEQYNGNTTNLPVSSVGSFDPNEKHGPVGLNGSAYHNGRSVLYTIFYENVDSATAPAQFVTILDTLNAALFSLGSARLMAIGIADSLHAVPSDRVGNYFTDLNYSFFNDLFVRVNFTVDTTSGVMQCHLLSLDEETFEPITDPLGGFLPPNATPPMGEGFIVISVDLKDGIGSGTSVENQAAIIFDTNELIMTNTHTHITDFDRPVSAVDVLSDSLNSNTINVPWTSSDPTSAVAYHNIYVKEQGSLWQVLSYQNAGSQTTFTGEWGKSYSFFSRAVDLAGNIEILDTNAIRSTLLWPEQLVLGFTATGITCADSSDAVLSAVGIGGVGPYTYLWSTGANTDSISGLDEGTYSVTVTDALGAQVDSTFVVEEPESLSLLIVEDSALSCLAGSTAQISASGTGGAEPYTFYWGGLNFWPTLSDISAGSYSVRLTDANGCVRRDSMLITSPSDLSATAVATTSQICDGTIIVTPSGGVPPYTIIWADEGLSGFSVSDLCPNTYAAIVEDAVGCSTAINVVVDFDSAINTIGHTSAISLRPNPTADNVTLTLFSDVNEILRIEIYDAIGRQLKQVPLRRIISGTSSIDISLQDYSIGQYLIKVGVGEVQYNLPVVKY